MIQLTRLNHVPFYLNSGLIELIESTPDTMITLTTGQKYLVAEGAQEVVDKFMQCQRWVYAAALKDVRNPDGPLAEDGKE